MEKNCLNCLLVQARIKDNGQNGWSCKRNGFAVNARMCCEEWTNTRIQISMPRSLSRQSAIWD
ncbi:MAG: hypothetical protein ACOCNM_00265 [Prevotella pectinovora]